MPLSTSNSETFQWKKFCLQMIISTISVFAILYGFIVLVDPWGMLPVSLPVHRIPISSNGRFSLPMLATDKKFDSAIFGTSTARLLRPELLNQSLQTHFVNLAMNSASPWEQSSLFHLFLQTHSTPKAVIFSLDTIWCLATETGNGITNRAFPKWMYSKGRSWSGYWHMANLYALQEAANQFLWLTGFKKQQYGSDGYTRFVPPESKYDIAKVRQHFAQWAVPNNTLTSLSILPEPSLNLLEEMLNQLPSTTLKIIIFPPLYAGLLGTAHSWTDIKWQSCKKRTVELTNHYKHIYVIDFAFPSTWTKNMESFWDPLHYRQPIADNMTEDIASFIHNPNYTHNVMQHLASH